MEKQTKLILEVLEAKLTATTIISSANVTIFFGKLKRKSNKVKKRTNHPVWNESFELCEYTALDLEALPEVSISIFELKKKIVASVKVDLKAVGLTNKAKEEQIEIKTNGVSIGHLKLRLTLGTGIPAKPIKLKKATSKTDKGKKKRDPMDIFQLVKKKDVVGLEDFLIAATPEEVNQQLPKSGNTILHEALLERAEECVPLLLNFDGIKVDVPNSSKNTPLHYFCEKWRSPAYLECFELFVQKGANVNAVNQNGETPIFKSIFNEVIRTLLMGALIEHGADVNVVNDRGESVLHYAVHLGRGDLVNLILRARPKLELKGAEGHTPLELARDVYKTTKIAAHLKDVSELFKWMDENDLGDYKALFIKNEISRDLLADLTDELLTQMGVDSWGARRKILNAAGKAGKTLSDEELKHLKQKDDIAPDASLVDFEKELHEMRGGGATNDVVVDGLQLEYLQLLGSGASGDVYKGLYKRKHVAIKVLKETAEAEVDEFKKEFEIMSAVRHPNVVFFYGVSTQPRLCMVMEYCARGSLFKVLKDDKLDFGWKRGIEMLKETTLGLQALHKNNIFHRDLKSLNLLVTQEWHAKLADFGLSRFNTNDNMDTMKQMRGTFAYVDPEVYNNRAFTAASDIYSLGIIFWEVANRVVAGKYAQPYSEYKHIQFDFQIVVQAAKSDLRPTIPAKCPPPFTQLINALLHKTQEERPSLSQIEEAITSIEASYLSDPAKWDATAGQAR